MYLAPGATKMINELCAVSAKARFETDEEFEQLQALKQTYLPDSGCKVPHTILAALVKAAASRNQKFSASDLGVDSEGQACAIGQ